MMKVRRMRFLVHVLGAFVLLSWPAAAEGEEKPSAPAEAQSTKLRAKPAVTLPRGFVDLARIAPAIRIEMRYATAQNFTGRKVRGYRANRCILARPVALALARVQLAVRAQGYDLKVFDCYRPARAVDAFVQWAEGSRSGNTTKFYYPRISRKRIIPLGFVARRSSHSRGTAIDLTLVRASPDGSRPLTSSVQRDRAATSCIDGSTTSELDMGTSWDCFDVLSHTYHKGISATAKANRKRLLRAMRAEGFRNYKREWWHFSMSLRRYTRLRDFPIE